MANAKADGLGTAGTIVGIIVGICGVVGGAVGVAATVGKAYTDKTIETHEARDGHAGMIIRASSVERDVVGLKVDVSGIRSTVQANRETLRRIENKLDKIHDDDGQ